MDKLDTCQVNEFLDDETSFINKMIKVFSRRQEVKEYFGLILEQIITEVESIDACLEFDVSRINEWCRRVDKITKKMSYDKASDISNIDIASRTKSSFLTASQISVDSLLFNDVTYIHRNSCDTLDEDINFQCNTAEWESVTTEEIFSRKQEAKTEEIKRFCSLLTKI